MNCMKADNEVKISFTGDIMVEHTRLESYRSGAGYDFSSLFGSCADLFSGSDYVVANLETPVAGEGSGYSYKNYNFNTPSEILTGLKDAHVAMVTTANNHALDRGVQGVDRTIDNIVAAGLDYTGTAKSNAPQKPLVRSFSGIKIGFLSYTYGTEACYNGHYLKPKEQYRVNLIQNQELYDPIQRFVVRSKSYPAKGIRFIIRRFKPDYFARGVEAYPQSDRDQRRHIAQDLAELRHENCDLILMCLHVGGQFNDEPTAFTVKTVQYLFDSGVDIVVGNHEHMIQRAELYPRDKSVAYCLGNFTSNYGIERAPYDKDAQCSILLHLYLKKDGRDLKRRWAFSVMLSTCDASGRIITKPLYDEYMSCTDADKKEELLKLNTSCLERFIGSGSSHPVSPQEEYDYSQLKEAK